MFKHQHRYFVEWDHGQHTVNLGTLSQVIAVAKELPHVRIYTTDAEGGYGDTGGGWHDGLRPAEREALHEAGLL